MAQPKFLISVLNELANTAKQSMRPEEWDKFLQPGRVLRRGDVAMPLKADEKRWSPLNQILRESTGKLTPSDLYGRLQTAIHGSPDFILGDNVDVNNPVRFYVQGDISNPHYDVGGGMDYINQYQLPGPKYEGNMKSEETFTPSQWENLTTVPGSRYVPGSHFNSEPGLLSWSRLTRRPEFETGKPLTNIEEIQSDWHRNGRELGYKEDNSLSTNEQTRLEQLRDKMYATSNRRNSPNPRDMSDLSSEEINELRYLEGRTHAYVTSPPSAPFSDKGYVGLELRKALDSATQFGDSGLTWTTGDQQGVRYGIRSQDIPLLTDSSDDFSKSYIGEHMEPEQAKMLSGMRDYYDRILPSEAGRIAKMYNVPGMGVGQTKIQGPRTGVIPNGRAFEEVPGLPTAFDNILDQLIGDHEGPVPTHEQISQIIDNELNQRQIPPTNLLLRPTQLTFLRHQLVDRRRAENMGREEQAQQAADNAHDELNDVLRSMYGTTSQPPQTVHGLSLPDEARRKIKDVGIPLFATGGRVKDSPLNAYRRFFTLPVPASLQEAASAPVTPSFRLPEPDPYRLELPFEPDQEPLVPDETDQTAAPEPTQETPAGPPSPPAIPMAGTAIPASPAPVNLGATPAQPATPSESVAYLRALAAKESGGDPNAQASTSSALGAYQFTDRTWADLAAAHPELKLTPGGRTDPAQAERAALALTVENMDILTRRGVEPTDANLYVAHFMGPSSAARFITALDADPSGRATGYVSPAAARANKTIFFDDKGNPRTVAQVYARLTRGFDGRSFVSSRSPGTSSAG